MTDLELLRGQIEIAEADQVREMIRLREVYQTAYVGDVKLIAEKLEKIGKRLNKLRASRDAILNRIALHNSPAFAKVTP